MIRETRLFKKFFDSEKAGGLILLIVTILSLLLANSSVGAQYIGAWDTMAGKHSITEWINEGLMTIFFLLVGLELEREFYKGELSDIKNSILPILAALGGTLVPVVIYTSLNFGTAAQVGAGIPMATDIAFAIGILSLLGKRVPVSLKIFLTAVAIIDDLAAILVIAIFYGKSIAYTNLLLSFAIFGLLALLNQMKVKNMIPYIIGGIAMWYFMLNSGIHATITGVLLAFVAPFGDGSPTSMSSKWMHFLHKPVSYIILPLFAMANTCIIINPDWHLGITTTASIGIILGLILGKPIGITLFSYLGVRLGLCTLPMGINWKIIAGVGMLGGIGFTMSMFVTLLAFTNSETIVYSKISILIASVFSGIMGYVWLYSVLRKKTHSATKR